MNKKVKRVYKSGLNNKNFLQAIKVADNDKKPTVFSTDLEKHLFASTYYGWLVAEYGINWESHL